MGSHHKIVKYILFIKIKEGRTLMNLLLICGGKLEHTFDHYLPDFRFRISIVFVDNQTSHQTLKENAPDVREYVCST